MTGSGAPRRYPGSPGLWIFILADLFLFGLYFVCLAFDMSRDPGLFATGSTTVHAAIGLANTLVLLTSSWLVVNAVQRDHSSPRRASALLFGGAAAGALFLVFKAFEYSDLIGRGYSVLSNNFFTWYFVLTALHATHVTAGMILLIQCGIDRRRATPRLSASYVEGVGCYWHMVDLLWIIIFTLLYLI